MGVSYSKKEEKQPVVGTADPPSAPPPEAWLVEPPLLEGAPCIAKAFWRLKALVLRAAVLWRASYSNLSAALTQNTAGTFLA